MADLEEIARQGALEEVARYNLLAEVAKRNAGKVSPTTIRESGSSQTPITSSSAPVASGGTSAADAGLTSAFKAALAEGPPVPVTAVPIAIVLEIDHVDLPITNGPYGWVSRVTLPCSIFSVTLQNVRGETGSVTINIQTCTPGASPTWTSICGASIPAIAGGAYYYDAVLTGWTKTIQRGQGLRVVLSGASAFTQISTTLGARRLDLTAPS